jgi:hypothetical protein
VHYFGFRGDQEPTHFLRNGVLFEEFKKGKSLKKPTVRAIFMEMFIHF